MDPKIEWTEAEGWPLYSGTLVGPQAVVDGVFMRLGEIGENFSVNVTQLVAEGDTVVGLGTCSWNRKGSGEPAEVKIAHVWSLVPRGQWAGRFESVRGLDNPANSHGRCLDRHN